MSFKLLEWDLKNTVARISYLNQNKNSSNLARLGEFILLARFEELIPTLLNFNRFYYSFIDANYSSGDFDISRHGFCTAACHISYR